jgi:hypothetical protein
MIMQKPADGRYKYLSEIILQTGIILEYGAYVIKNHIMPKDKGLKLFLNLKNKNTAVNKIATEENKAGLKF